MTATRNRAILLTSGDPGGCGKGPKPFLDQGNGRLLVLRSTSWGPFQILDEVSLVADRAFDPSDLLEAQWKHTQDLARLVQYVDQRGWRVKITELGILPERRAYIDNATGYPKKVRDAVHKLDGNHYRNLAADIQIFLPDPDRHGLWYHVTSSEHPAWIELEGFWKSLDKDNVSGRSWNDANHFSRKWQGIS